MNGYFKQIEDESEQSEFEDEEEPEEVNSQ